MLSLKKSVVILAVMSAASAQAAFVEFTPSKQVFETVTLSDQAKIKYSNQEVVMNRLGKGLREKPTIFGRVRVTVAELFAAPDKFKRTEAEALNSLLESDVVTMHQTFLRNVTAAQIQTAYKEAFAANQAIMTEASLAMDKSPLKEFLAKVAETGDTDAGQFLTVTVIREAGKTTMVYENGAGEQYNFVGPEGLAKLMVSLWFGVPADDGVKDLKAALLTGP